MHAQISGAQDRQPLQVAIMDALSIVVRDAVHNWSGPSVELWLHAGGTLSRDHEFVEMSLGGMMEARAAGKEDVVVGALSVTAAREVRFDSTHQYHSTRFGIATRDAHSSHWLDLVLPPIFGPFSALAGM